MCLIIHKKPDVEIPFEKIWSASVVNPDGFGIAVADRGKLEVQKSWGGTPTDPEAVSRALEQTIGLPTLIHFRFRTLGEKSLTNCHPFELKKSDGSPIVFAHNGTLHSLLDHAKLSGIHVSEDASDSAAFAQGILQPLFERSPSEDLLNDSLLLAILREYAGTTNVFSFMDGDGKSLIINKTRGKEYDFGWASNEYSLNRKPPSTPSKPNNALVVHPSIDQTAHNLKSILAKPSDERAYGLCPAHRETFEELTNISLEELQYYAEEDFLTLCKRWPDGAALLILDLLWEIFGAQTGGHSGSV